MSPAEPKQLREIGKVSSAPETYGADFLFHSRTFGSVGVQRKELGDLVASVQDGRLGKELLQMKALGLAVLIVEGRERWTDDGLLLSSFAKWTKAQHLGTLLSVQLSGCWTLHTSSMTETIESLSTLTRWTEGKHGSLTRRPSARSVFGAVDSRDWGVHFLQGFQGIGYEKAAAIYDYYGGLPLTWTIDEEELSEVRGIGKQTAKRLIGLLNGTG